MNIPKLNYQALSPKLNYKTPNPKLQTPKPKLLGLQGHFQRAEGANRLLRVASAAKLALAKKMEATWIMGFYRDYISIGTDSIRTIYRVL